MIRPFVETDEAAVLRLWSECELIAPQNDPAKDIRRKLRVNPEWFLVAEIEGRVVGTCMTGYEGHRGWINYLAVSPAHRRRGLGSRLVEEAERLLRAAGCPKINLQVRSTNTEVIAFYEAVGFSVDSVTSLGKRLEVDAPHPHCLPSVEKVVTDGALPLPPADYVARVPRFAEARSLVPVGVDCNGRDAFLEAETASAWNRMKTAAAADGVEFLLVSAFRSHAYQARIVRRKIERGQSLDEILSVSAYPGHSEHHTGRAIDIGRPGCTDLTEDFESTAEFAWLSENAAKFGFALSFPRDNPWGIIYEPWHWAHTPTEAPKLYRE